MIANIESSSFNADNGTINVVMNNTTINGYKNKVLQYQTAQTLSMPVPGNLVALDVQADTQMQIIGYNSRIIDTNYEIAPGDFTSYSNNWYLSTRNIGIEAQQANSSNKENLMGGQSTNLVLNDIMQLLIDVISYLGTHIHSGVQTGSGTTGTVTVSPPDDSAVVADQTYINANHNLFITGTYEPK